MINMIRLIPVNRFVRHMASLSNRVSMAITEVNKGPIVGYLEVRKGPPPCLPLKRTGIPMITLYDGWDPICIITSEATYWLRSSIYTDKKFNK